MMSAYPLRSIRQMTYAPGLASGAVVNAGTMLRWLSFSLILLVGCKSDLKSDDPRIARYRLSDYPTPDHPAHVGLMERGGPGHLIYIGLDAAPSPAKPGDLLELTHYFQVESAPALDWTVFVHGESGAQRILNADHPPILGRRPTSVWEKGEIWADRHKTLVPKHAQGTLKLFVGLFRDGIRMTTVAPPARHDGRDRIRAAQLPLAQGQLDLPEVVIPRIQGSITADGQLNEPEWEKAPVLTFSDTLGRSISIRYPTRMRLLYDQVNLYVAFEATDQDITERYQNRDDPIYEHETVELFLMPQVQAPKLGPYVELQASPGGVIFDASFTGRRQGMDKSFEAGQQVGTHLDGTLNQPDQDRRWISEWIVPFKGIRWLKTAPKAGDEWRMNAFRIEKYRENGKTVGEYSAWSPPQVGDFHNTARFGRMKFGS